MKKTNWIAGLALPLLLSSCGGSAREVEARAATPPPTPEQLRLNARSEALAEAIERLNRASRPKVVRPILKPRAGQLDLATLGPEPSHEVIMSAIGKALGSVLTDPSSAQVEISSASKGYYFANETRECRFGWRVDFTHNSKNSFGIYVGKANATAFILNGAVVAIVVTDFADLDNPTPHMLEIGSGGLTATEAGICDYYDN